MPGLRVLAGSSLDTLVPISHLVNKNEAFHIQSDLFEGDVVVHIKGFGGSDDGDGEYFGQPERQGITWSIQVQGRFLKEYSANDILFGNTFDRPLSLPWGSSAALKFMHYIDPTLEHDLTSSTRPWALSPLVSTMPHFVHTQTDEQPPIFPPDSALIDDTSDLYLTFASTSPSSSSSSLSSSSSSSRGSNKSSSSSFSRKAAAKLSLKKKSKAPPDASNLKTASQRRAFFASEANRQAAIFGPRDVITTDFCYGFLEFNPSLALRLPGGLSFDLRRYWDGQPVRFVCCERGTGGQPWGRIFWCLTIENDDSEEVGSTGSGSERDVD